MPDSQEISRLDALATHWSLIVRARDGSETAVIEARRALVLRYDPAIRRYIGAMVENRDDADDLVQDVLVRMMEGDFAGADPARGRFRDFLKVAIRNMARNFWAKNKRRQAERLSSDDVADAGARAGDPWLAAWRQSVLDLAWAALEEKERERTGSVLYTVLRLRTEHPDDTCDELALRLSEKIARPVTSVSLRQQLRRARVQFAELAMVETAQLLSDPTPHKIREELRTLGLLEYIRDLLPLE
jgi:RNA polymerase sigma factor (sigma-70 family)